MGSSIIIIQQDLCKKYAKSSVQDFIQKDPVARIFRLIIQSIYSFAEYSVIPYQYYLLQTFPSSASHSHLLLSS